MVEAAGTRLLGMCESLSDRLRRDVGLSSFRIELQRATRPLVVSLRAPDAISNADPRHDWMRPTPARLDLTLRHDRRVLAHVVIEDDKRARYTDDARTACERILEEYAPELSVLIAAQSI